MTFYEKVKDVSVTKLPTSLGFSSSKPNNCQKMNGLLHSSTVKTVAYFKHGALYDVSPREKFKSLYDSRDIAYKAKFIVSDGIRYNLQDKKSVFSIAVPEFSNNVDTTYSLDYVLRMVASNLRNEGKNELSIYVLWKAIEIMPHSAIAWTEKDYLRVVAWLYEDHNFIEGDRLRHYIQTDSQIQSKVDLTAVIKANYRAVVSKGDLVSFSRYNGVCCEICATYSGRVYSVSGKNKRFPALPAFLKDCGCSHPCCGTGVHPYWDGEGVMYRGQRVPIDTALSRPYTDDRTQAEIEAYEQAVKRLNDYNEHLDRLREYHLCCSIIPDMPKSLSAYTRMKNQKSPRYQKIVAAASKAGIEIMK